MLTIAAVAPSRARNGPLMLAPPSYVVSAKRLTNPIVKTKRKAIDAEVMDAENCTPSPSLGRWGRAEPPVAPRSATPEASEAKPISRVGGGPSRRSRLAPLLRRRAKRSRSCLSNSSRWGIAPRSRGQGPRDCRPEALCATSPASEASRDGGAEGNRTLDPHVANVVLSHLSYCPIPGAAHCSARFPRLRR